MFLPALHPDFWFPNRKPLGHVKLLRPGAPASAFYLCREAPPVDACGFSSRGTASTAVTVAQSDTGACLNFDGAAGVVTVPASAANTDINRGPMTVAFRVNFDAGVRGIGTLIDKTDGNAANAGWEVFFSTSNPGAISFMSEYSSANLKAASLAGMPSSGWHHGALTYDGSLNATGVIFYIDGVATAHNVSLDVNGSGTPGTDLARSLIIGNAQGARTGNGFLNGKLDLLILDRRVWTPAEIAENAAYPFKLLEPAAPILVGGLPASTAAILARGGAAGRARPTIAAAAALAGRVPAGGRMRGALIGATTTLTALARSAAYGLGLAPGATGLAGRARAAARGTAIFVGAFRARAISMASGRGTRYGGLLAGLVTVRAKSRAGLAVGADLRVRAPASARARPGLAWIAVPLFAAAGGAARGAASALQAGVLIAGRVASSAFLGGAADARAVLAVRVRGAAYAFGRLVTPPSVNTEIFTARARPVRFAAIARPVLAAAQARGTTFTARARGRIFTAQPR